MRGSSPHLLGNDESIQHEVLQRCNHGDIVEGVGYMEHAMYWVFDNGGGEVVE